MRQYEEAADQLERAVRRSPHAAAPRWRLAECLLELGKPREAATHLEFVRVRHAGDANIQFTQARLLIYRGQLDEAKRVLEQILAGDPGHVQALVERGQLEYRHGDAQQALAWLQRAVEVDPGKVEAWQGLVHCHESLDRPREAGACREELDRVLRELGEMTRLEIQDAQRPAAGIALPLELAIRCERVHLDARAAAWRMKILQTDPQHGPTHRALADYYERSGQPHRAARHRALVTP
jgi:tetratricopeptide (TPR) repeat protein